MKARDKVASSLALLLALATGLFWALGEDPAQGARDFANAAPAGPTPKHFVTPAQLTQSGGKTGIAVSSFTAVDHRGQQVMWSELSDSRPVVLVFVKEGCPCNVEFQSVFNRVAATYQDVARFVGVMDADADTARRYVDDNRVPYPMLADSSRSIIKSIGAENGAYVSLVQTNGVVETLWPGCSIEMMRELGARLAAIGHVEERSFDCAELPKALTTGCPFEL